MEIVEKKMETAKKQLEIVERKLKEEKDLNSKLLKAVEDRIDNLEFWTDGLADILSLFLVVCIVLELFYGAQSIWQIFWSGSGQSAA